MFHKGGLVALVLVALMAPHSGIAQPGPLNTVKNTPLFFPASELVSNGFVGLTNPPSKLMVSAVAAASASGGSVSLINTQVWARYYSTYPPAWNQAASVKVDEGGNVYVAGSSSSTFVTVKYSATGLPLWTNRYLGSGPGNGYVCTLTLDPPGNAYVTGYTMNTNGVYDVAIIKYSSNGAALWTNRFNDSVSNGTAPQALVTDDGGNCYVLINNIFVVSGIPTCTLVKYGPAGNGVWTNRYNDPAHFADYPVALALDSAGNLLVASSSEGSVTGDDYAVLKYTSDGACLWTNRYTRGFADIASAMALDRAGNVIVTGDSLGVGPHQYPTIKFGSDGMSLWTNILVGPTYQGGAVPQVVTDLAGNVLVSGGSAGATNTGDYTILKLAPNGIPLWTNRFIGLGATNGILTATATDSAGNVYAAGYSVPPGGAYNEFVLAKYARDGTALWTNHFDGPAGADAWAQGMAVSPAGNIHLIGMTVLGGQSQFATVKFADYIHYTPPTNFSGQDSFGFTVTDSDGNSVTSVVAITVSALPQLTLQPIGRDFSNGLRLQVNGASDSNQVVLYASTNLVDWVAVATNMPTTGSCEFLDPTASTLSRRFYRASQ
jgi:hypothetical protein